MDRASAVRRWSRRLLIGAALVTTAALLLPVDPAFAAPPEAAAVPRPVAPAEAPDRDATEQAPDQAAEQQAERQRLQEAAERQARAQAAAAARAARLAAARQRARTAWLGHGQPHRLVIVRTGSVDLVTDGRLTRRAPGLGGAPTLRALDRTLPDSWLRITDGRADLAAAVLLTPGVTLTLGADLPAVRLVGGPQAADAATDLHRRRPARAARGHRRLAGPADRGPAAGRAGPAVRRGVGRRPHRVHRLGPHRPRHAGRRSRPPGRPVARGRQHRDPGAHLVAAQQHRARARPHRPGPAGRGDHVRLGRRRPGAARRRGHDDVRGPVRAQRRQRGAGHGPQHGPAGHRGRHRGEPAVRGGRDPPAGPADRRRRHHRRHGRRAAAEPVHRGDRRRLHRARHADRDLHPRRQHPGHAARGADRRRPPRGADREDHPRPDAGRAPRSTARPSPGSPWAGTT